jgi:hypothetical protein
MRFFWLVVLSWGLCVAGCGEPEPTSALPPVFPVKGKVIYRGKGLEGVVVQLNPLFDSIKFTPEGKTGADGSFSVSCGPDGAPAGEYVVTFSYPQQTDPGDEGSMVDRWKGKYSDPKKSKFKVKIVDGPNELPAFKLD